ncbi:hypothetical protein [Pseudorhodoplanes sinuspersici]|nr:hypothetical protein [Pseudorhodoplanes sinuspersici]
MKREGKGLHFQSFFAPFAHPQRPKQKGPADRAGLFSIFQGFIPTSERF